MTLELLLWYLRLTGYHGSNTFEIIEYGSVDSMDGMSNFKIDNFSNATNAMVSFNLWHSSGLHSGERTLRPPLNMNIVKH